MKINAHIPTQQYGFIELTDLPDDPKEIERLYNRYAEKPISLAVRTKRLVDFFGNEIDYDEASHTYSWQGERYVSGSEYAKQFEKAFDAEKTSVALADKWGVDATEIRKMWELKRDISAGLGTMLHAALELYGKYNGLATQMEKTTALHDHPVVKEAVTSFYKAHKEKAAYEVLVVDHKNKRAGRIDRLVVLGDKRGRVEDFKTNAELTKDKLAVYWEQLEFYSKIMNANGWTMDSPVIHHWNGSWMTYKQQESQP